MTSASFWFQCWCYGLWLLGFGGAAMAGGSGVVWGAEGFAPLPGEGAVGYMNAAIAFACCGKIRIGFL
jgi:hypothetical protein